MNFAEGAVTVKPFGSSDRYDTVNIVKDSLVGRLFRQRMNSGGTTMRSRPVTRALFVFSRVLRKEVDSNHVRNRSKCEK